MYFLGILYSSKDQNKNITRYNVNEEIKCQSYRAVVFFNVTIRRSRNLKGMGTHFRRNDLRDHLGGQALLMTG